MALFSSNEQDYLVLHLGGGSVHGLSQMQVLIFLEEAAGIPISWMFDMIAGDSFGSVPAAALNIPESPGSKKPRFSAKRTAEVAEDVLVKTFNPYQENYHRNMVKLEIQIKALEEAILVIEGLKDPESGLTSRFLGAAIAPLAIPILTSKIEQLREKSKSVFFSFEHAHKALDKHFRFNDSTPVKLGQTITGFHSEAFNLDRLEPTTHTYIPPVGGWGGHISHPGITISDCSKRSMAAQTYFKPYKSEHNGEHFDDIAHHNTMASVMNSLRRKFTKAAEGKELNVKLNRKGLSVGVGTAVPKLDPKRMQDLLILDRLDSNEGAPLIQIPVLYNTTKAIRDLREELGPENVTFIEKLLDPALIKNKYRYRQMVRDNPHINKKTLRAHLEHEASRIPRYNLIDARPETIRKIKEVGWAMVNENRDELIGFAKRGLQRAYERKLISEETLKTHLKRIDKEHPISHAHSPNKSKSFIDFLTFGGALPSFGFGMSNDTDKPQPTAPRPANDDKKTPNTDPVSLSPN